MPETASLAHILTPVQPGNKSARGLNPDRVRRELSDNTDSAAGVDDTTAPKRSCCDKGRESDDFDKVLSRKIKNEQTPDKPSQEASASSEPETVDSHLCCSVPAQVNHPLENTQRQPVPAVIEVNHPLNNAGDVQLAVNAGVVSETTAPVHPLNGQPSMQIPETAVPPAAPEAGKQANLTVPPELPVGEKQIPAQAGVMTEQAAVSKSPNAEAVRAVVEELVPDTAGKPLESPDTAVQVGKQLSDTSDAEPRPVKPVDPDFRGVLRGTEGAKPHDLPVKPENQEVEADYLAAADHIQEEGGDIKLPQGIPVEAEAPVDGDAGTPKGFGIRNVESMLHSANPSENASLSAMEAPARTGVHSNGPQTEPVNPVDQIVQHVGSISVSGPQQRIQLTLTPEHLGTVRITFNQTEDEVVGLLEIQKNQTRREVEQALPQLMSAMQGSGVQVRRIEVVQWDAGQDAAEDGGAKESDYSATGRFHDESSSNSSQSERFENEGSVGQSQKSTRSAGISGPNNQVNHTDSTENGLNLFI